MIGIRTFLYQCDEAHACVVECIKSSGTRKSPENIQPIVHAISWKTFTMLVKISPTYPWKKEGECSGAETTFHIDCHIGVRVRNGKMSLYTVQSTRMKGYPPAGMICGKSWDPDCNIKARNHLRFGCNSLDKRWAFPLLISYHTTLTYLVIEQHESHKYQGIVNRFFENTDRSGHNPRIEIKEVNVVDAESSPDKDAAPPKPLETQDSTTSAEDWKGYPTTNGRITFL
jgi:hypothetical protein